MEMDVDVLCAGVKLLVASEGNCRLRIGVEGHRFLRLVDLGDKLAKPDGFLRCMGSGNVLGFSGGESHNGLSLGTPGDSTSVDEESISGYCMPVLI